MCSTGKVISLGVQYVCVRKQNSILANQASTVEPLKEDPPRKGHCIKYLSTKDKTKSPNLSLPINIMHWNLLKEDNLYKGDKSLEFILVPKCPFLGGSTVVN